MVIIGYALYRAWRSSDERWFNIDLDVFSIAGGAGVLMISGSLLYVAFRAWQGAMLNASVSGSDLIKAVFVCNAFAALTAPVIAFFGLKISRRMLQLISPQRH
jgi:hypothetical protein